MSTWQDPYPHFVLPLVATTKDRGSVNVGSCVVIAVAKKRAIALTAYHVIDYVLNSYDDNWRTDLNVPEAFRKPRYGEKFGLEDEANAPELPTIFAVLPFEKCIAPVFSAKAFGGRNLDIACLRLEIPLDFDVEFTSRAAIRSFGPTPGEHVQLCGFPEGNKFDYDLSGGQLTLSFDVKRLVLSGDVTRRFDWNEDFLVRSPGFQVAAPSPSGFSGGAVIANDPMLGPSVVGIISSSDGVTTKAPLIWPALGLDHGIPSDGSVPSTLLEMLRSLPRAITDRDDAANHVRIDPDKISGSLADYISWVA